MSRHKPSFVQRSKLDGALRSHVIAFRVNEAELARLEERRQQVGVKEMAAYVRQAALARRPIAIVPELNRTAWVDLITHLEALEELAQRLRQGPVHKPAGGLPGLLGRGRGEDPALQLLAEVTATQAAIQALRRSLLGSERGK